MNITEELVQETQAVEPKVRKTRTVYNVDNADIVRAWNTSETAKEAAEKVKMPKPILEARVSNLRKLGVPMKEMTRVTSRKTNVEDLSKLAESLLTPEQLQKIQDKTEAAAAASVEEEVTETSPA